MGRRQVLFVIDVGSLVGAGPEEQHVQQARAICLACCRILVHLAGAPSAKNIEKIKWSYQILPTGVRDISAVQSNTRTKFHDLRFQDLRSESLEILYKHVIAESSSCEVTMTSAPSLIYSGLASAVQDYLWEAPDLTTPTPLCLRKRGRRNTSSLPTSHSNLIFLFSSLPHDQQELDMFCGRRESQLESARLKIKEKILSGPLISQLISKDIALHWIESGNTSKRQESIAAGLDETVHTLIGRTGGSLVSMDSLVTSSHMVPVASLLHSSLTRDEVEQAYSTGRHLLCGPDGESLCILDLTHTTPLSKVEQFFGTRNQESSSDLHETSDSQRRFDVGGVVSRWCLCGVVQSGSYPVSILDLEQSYHCVAGDCDEAMGVSLGMAAVDTKKSSNVFQTICFWLTNNKFDLVITIHQNQSSHNALFHPVSSIMATVTILNEPFSLPQITDGNADDIWSSLLSSTPFSVHNPLTSDVLLPWYPLGSTCGVPSSTVEHLKETQSNHRMDSVVQSTRGHLLSQLQSVYSGSQVKIGTLYEEDPIAPPATTAADEVSSKPSTVSQPNSSVSYIEALDNLTIGYGQLLLEEPTEMVRVLDWVRYSFQYLEASLQDSSQESAAVWEGLQELLLSDSELRDKYAGIEGEDAEEKEKIRIRMAYDYQIQVLLHLAAARFSGEDTTTLANQIVALLRRVSLLTHPGVMGRLLKDIILPEFAGTGRSLLMQVYEGLMLPLPLALSPPSSPITPHSSTSSESESEEDEWSNHRSLGSKPSTWDTKSAQSLRVLTRCNSFHGLQTQRQIVVKRSRKSSPDNNAHSSGKGARRSLFSRSFSVAGSSSSSSTELRKRKGDSWQWHGHSAKKSKGKHKDDVIVNATPIKKQVENYWQFKLQRRRSKSSIMSSPGVKVIEESPQRSFYSSAIRPSVDGFRTPPSASKSRQQVFVKKDPSPAGLHSLLHGEIISPQVTPEGRRGFLSCSTPPLATVSECGGSPELLSSGGSVSGSECGDRVHHRRGIAVARSLSYGKEDNSEDEEIFLRTPVKVVSDSDILTPQKSILKTPERLSQTPKKSVTFLHGVDPLENDSASMVAFALCTPTKEDSVSFSGIL